MPSSATEKGWRAWHEQARAEHPVRYWLQEALWKRQVLRRARRVRARLQDLVWALRYRLVPRHRYHELATGLAPGYHDLRTRQLHALFDSFARFYAHEAGPHGHVDWSAEEPYARAFAEMGELYRWWTQERPARLEREHELLRADRFQAPELQGRLLPMLDEGLQDHPEIQAWRKRSEERQARKQQGLEEDQRMLHRLVDLRPFLW